MRTPAPGETNTARAERSVTWPRKGRRLTLAATRMKPEDRQTDAACPLARGPRAPVTRDGREGGEETQGGTAWGGRPPGEEGAVQVGGGDGHTAAAERHTGNGSGP